MLWTTPLGDWLSNVARLCASQRANFTELEALLDTGIGKKFMAIIVTVFCVLLMTRASQKEEIVFLLSMLKGYCAKMERQRAILAGINYMSSISGGFRQFPKGQMYGLECYGRKLAL